MFAAIAATEWAAAQTPTDPLVQTPPYIPPEVKKEQAGQDTHLTGDWGGARATLIEHGVEFTFDYTGEVLSSVSGGRRRGTAYNGLLESAVDMDLEKLVNWKGGEFYVDSLWFHGPSLSLRDVGDIFGISNIDDYDTIRLYELWIQQKFLDERMSLKLGQLASDRDFACTEYTDIFINSTLGMPVAIWLNSPTLTYYVAATGARLRADPIDEFYIQAGVYDGNPDPTAGSGTDPSNLNSSGTRISLNDGAFILMESGYKLNHEEDAAGLPGNYKLGGWIHTDRFTDQYDQTLTYEQSALAPPTDRVHRGNYGVYFSADQRVFREKEDSEEGLGVFSRVSGNPSDRNQIDFYVDAGCAYTGAIPTRDDDVCGIGFAYAAISDDVRRAYRDMNSFGEGPLAVPDYEAVLEITYQAAVTPWWTLQPDFQWVFHPGGSDALSDAVIVGIRTTISF